MVKATANPRVVAIPTPLFAFSNASGAIAQPEPDVISAASSTRSKATASDEHAGAESHAEADEGFRHLPLEGQQCANRQRRGRYRATDE
jgi:hypothetical protein